MENWGLVTFRESAVLFDPSTGSVADKKLVTMIVNHELAHQVRAMFSPHQDTCASRCVDATLNIFVYDSILNLVCSYNQLQKILTLQMTVTCLSFDRLSLLIFGDEKGQNY